MSPTTSPIENGPARQLLRQHGLHLTAVREQVLGMFLRSREAIAQSDLEAALGPVNRITLYRTLRTFEEKGLIHRAIDGTEKLKFALCHSGCSSTTHLDHHAHLHCGRCGRTVCVDGIQAPDQLHVPGFVINSAYLVLQGLCEGCR